MSALSMSRVVVPLIALVAGGGAALTFAYRQAEQARPVETKSVTGAAATSDPKAGGQDRSPAALSAVQAEANRLANSLTGPPSPPAGGDSGPEFDIVRIEPNGEAVIAGRATPGATVELLRNGQPHDRVVADQSGQFALVPRPLPPGNYDLTLRVKQGDGKEVTSKQSVAVALESNPNERPIVALIAPDKPARVLSQAPTSGAGAAKVAVEAVETEAGGKLHVSGHAHPGATVRLYLNDSFVASATAAEDGRLAVTINQGVAPGNYRVRLDEVESGTAKVRARAEVPFNVPDTVVAGSIRAPAMASNLPEAPELQEPRLAAAEGAVAPDTNSPSSVVVPKITTATVSRGDSLWRISQRTMGAGQRYAVIYRANKGQIRNPNLIYPGQVFSLPKVN